MILCFILVALHSGLVKNNRDKSPQSPNFIFLLIKKAIDIKKIPHPRLFARSLISQLV